MCVYYVISALMCNESNILSLMEDDIIGRENTHHQKRRKVFVEQIFSWRYLPLRFI